MHIIKDKLGEIKGKIDAAFGKKNKNMGRLARNLF